MSLSLIDNITMTSGNTDLPLEIMEFNTYFSIWLEGPAAPPPAVLRSAAIGRNNLNSGGSSSSVYNLSEK